MDPSETPAFEERRHRFAVAMYGLHRKSFYLSGLTTEGQAWLDSGRALGPNDGDMPLNVGMQRHECCAVCRHDKIHGDNWPCETVKLCIESGFLPPEIPWDELETPTDTATAVVDPHRDGAYTNVRPDGRYEVRKR